MAQVDVSMARLFDAMCDQLGAPTATEVMTSILEYRDTHTGCVLPGPVDVTDDGFDVAIRFHHQPGCPSLQPTEGVRP